MARKIAIIGGGIADLSTGLHFFVGTTPGNPMHKVWQELGALKELKTASGRARRKEEE
jgi:hypothetical protein